MTSDELEAEIQQMEKQKKIDKLKEYELEKQNKIEQEKQQKDKEYRESVEQEIKQRLLEEQNKGDNKPPILVNTPEKINQFDNSKDAEMHESTKRFIKRFEKRYNAKFTEYGDFEDYVPVPGFDREDYSQWSNELLEFEGKQDSGCEDVIDSWSPADSYCNMIWFAMHCVAGLQKICARTCDISKGKGNTIQIKTISKGSAPVAKNACDCLSCSSDTFSTHSLTLSQLGMMRTVCEFDVWDVGESLRTAQIQNMAMRWAEYFDAQIYAALSGATPGTLYTSTTSFTCDPGLVGSCCSFRQDLYRAVLDVEARMRINGYNPDYLIVNPRVANYLKLKETPTAPPWMAGELKVQDGILIKFGGLNVIEYCGANTCTDSGSAVIAIVIDSSRAVGEAFGRKPFLVSEYVEACNATEYVMWAYWAVGALDTEGIGHIVNP